jgi:hypothetical protein
MQSVRVIGPALAAWVGRAYIRGMLCRIASTTTTAPGSPGAIGARVTG